MPLPGPDLFGHALVDDVVRGALVLWPVQVARLVRSRLASPQQSSRVRDLATAGPRAAAERGVGAGAGAQPAPSSAS